MEHFVGIDVAKDRLDVHVRPSGESFAVARDGETLAGLVERLAALAPALIVIEATGGYETVVASAIGAAQWLLAVVNPRQIRDFARPPASWPKPIGSTRRRSPISPKRSGRQCGRSPMPKHKPWASWWPAAAKSSR